MENPKRIQRKRTKGWRMPENTIYVGRPSNWGNYWQVGNIFIKDGCRVAMSAKECVERFRADMLRFNEACPTMFYEAVIKPLRGKNLACWCKEGEPCHADILLELANLKQ